MVDVLSSGIGIPTMARGITFDSDYFYWLGCALWTLHLFERKHQGESNCRVKMGPRTSHSRCMGIFPFCTAGEKRVFGPQSGLAMRPRNIGQTKGILLVALEMLAFAAGCES